MYQPKTNEDILIDLVEELGLSVDINHKMRYIILEMHNGRKLRFDSDYDAIVYIRNNILRK